MAAHADVAALLSDYDGPKPARGLAMMMAIGIAEGFDAVNDQLKQAGSPPLYCSPVKLKGDQLMDILRMWIEANRAKSPRIEAAPPGSALLYALTDAFPCPKMTRKKRLPRMLAHEITHHVMAIFGTAAFRLRQGIPERCEV